jgi:hypothetical protein
MPFTSWSLPKTTDYFSDFALMTLQCGWTQQVISPTRGPHILDLIFTNGFHSVTTYTGDALPGCDHQIVYASLNLPVLSRNMPILPTSTNYKSFDLNGFQQFLRSHNWTSFFATSDPTLAAECFYSILHEYLITQSIPRHYVVRNPYPKKLLKTLRKLRIWKSQYYQTCDFSLLLLIQKTNTQLDTQRLLRLRNEEVAAVSSPNLSQSLSQLLKRRSKLQQNPTYLTLPDGKVVDTDTTICEAFSDYFAESLVPEHNASPPQSDPMFPVLSHISLDSALIRKHLSKLKQSYSPDPDGIPPALLRLCDSDLPDLLLNLFNLSLQSSIVPPHWKKSIIIPRHKGGSPFDITNYRPINHIPAIIKIFERIVKDSLTSHLLCNSILHPAQHGFIRGRSTNTCQLDFLNLVTSSVDSNKSLILIYLDMSKAFDRVPHSHLLAKLHTYGVSEPLLSWFKSYFHGRTQTVKFGQTSSNPRPVTSGVIQGSVLGPILFLLFINDIVDCFLHGSPFLFADDIKILYAFPHHLLPQYIVNISSDLANLDTWSTRWGMRFSPNKCCILPYRCSIPPNHFTLNNDPIPQHNSVRDLGLRYSITFNYTEHIAYQIAKGRQLTGYICTHMKTTLARVHLFKLMVRPILEQYPTIYSSIRKCDRVALENVQRAFTKMVCGTSSILSYRERCDQLQLEPLWLRRIKMNLVLLFTLVHHQIDAGSIHLSFQTDSRYNLRNKINTLPIPQVRTALRSNFFSVRYLSIWNKLPMGLRTCTDLRRFKSALSQYLTISNAVALVAPQIPINTAFEHGLPHI